MSSTPIDNPAYVASSEGEMPTPQRKDKGNAPAAGPSEHVSDAGSPLFEDDSDGELSDDPAPYAGRTLMNKKLTSKETFAPHDTDPTKIEATFKIKMPDGNSWFIQKDTIPEKRDSADENLYKADDGVFFPDLENCKVPKKDKEKKSSIAVRWNKVAENRWERTFKGKHEVFTPSIALRRFNARTHAYEHIHIGQSKLNNIDPNNKKWKDAYNKWIDQISRRSNAAYQKKKMRDHWSVAEICAMYTGINAYVHANGIDAYDNMSTADLKTIINAINAVDGKNRGLDALRGQIVSAHETKNATMAHLRDNCRDFRDLIEGGGIVSDDERFPTHIIPLTEFPVEKRSNSRKGHRQSKGPQDNKSTAGPVSKKRKRDDNVSASDSDEEAEGPGDDSEDEEAEHGYGTDAGETSDEEEHTVDEPEDVEADPLPQPKKARLTDHAMQMARELLKEESDEDE